MANNHGYILHKTDHKKRCKHDYIFENIKNYPITLKEVVVNVFDLGHLGVEKDFPEQISSLPYIKKRNQQDLS